MTELTLDVQHDIVLPPELESQIYSTNTVINHIELQTLEKGYQAVTATSKDASSITWNVPSISGGSIVREIELEIPLKWSITYNTGGIGNPPSATTPIPANSPMFQWNLGSSVRPFLRELCCLDQFPLSKIMRNRTYRFNMSSVSLREDLSPEQIDLMVAQMNLEKMANDGLEVFADANCHFDTLDLTTGGILLPYCYINSAIGSVQAMSDIWEYKFTHSATLTALVNSTYANLFKIGENFTYIKCKSADWIAKRNTARNIFSTTVTYTSGLSPASAGYANGYGSNLVPVLPDVGGGLVPPGIISYFRSAGNTITIEFETIVRECLISQYWDHPYNFNEFSWNKLIPLSTLDMKFSYDMNYLQNSVLKIGDTPRHFNSYSTPVVTIGDQTKCKFIMKQCKIPLPLQKKEAYKVLYYSQESPQTAKSATVNVPAQTITAKMEYANLSQVPEYVFLYMPINKANFCAYGVTSGAGGPGPATPMPYQLPSVFNLPITNLTMTINSDTGLCTYEMDMFRLQQLTLQNLQDDEKLRDLIVGKSTDFIGKVNTMVGVTYSAGISTDVNYINNLDFGAKVHPLLNRTCTAGNGISNGSFFILKFGTQLRLPDGMSPSMIVNYNLSVTTTCDLNSPYLRNYSDEYFDLSTLKTNLGALQAGSPNAFQLEVVHFIKKIFTLSGSANQQLYVHDVMITGEQYYTLRNKYESTFDSEVRDDMPFGADQMIGGSFMSSLKDKAMKAVNHLLPQVKQVLKTARKGVDFAKDNLKDDSSLQKYLDYADKGLKFTGNGRSMNPQVISAGTNNSQVISAGAKKGTSKGAADWRQFLKN